jgi:16S rRNA (cytosine967-C5)-methyltransferase
MNSLSGKHQSQEKRIVLGVAPARLAAFRALREITGGSRGDSGSALDRAVGALGLDERDTRLATALALGVLRHRLFLTHQVLRFVRRRPPEPLLLLLEMVAAQRFLLGRVPPHAIVDDAVRLATGELRLGRREAGFVNAVARRIVAAPAAELPPPEDRERHLSVKYSCPPVLLEMARERFGEAAMEQVLAAMSREPVLALRVNRLRTTREDLSAFLRALGIECEAGRWAPDAVIVQDASMLSALLRSEPWQTGQFYVQDEASQLVAVLAAPRAGERILDLCAAPGGKCLHVAEIAGGAAHVVATDGSAKRLELLRENARRLGMPGLDLRPPEALGRGDLFDLVLLDAPCSGLGTVRRHPEIKERLAREGRRGLLRHQRRQVELLCRAAAFTAPGGRLVYSTCSFADEENAGAVARFLEVRPDFAIATDWPVPSHLEPLRAPDGFVRTWPMALDMDGFEMCVLRRREGAA